MGIFASSQLESFVQKITQKFQRKSLTGDMTGNTRNLCYLKNQTLSAYQELNKSNMKLVSGVLDPGGLESPGPIFKNLILSVVSFFQTVH